MSLPRIFCAGCGREIEDNDLSEYCPTCHREQFITFDAETAVRTPSLRKTKPHPNSCECDKCEELGTYLKELDFGSMYR